VDVLPRVHSLLIGPGLGRHPLVLEVAAQVVLQCRARKIPMVIDADGLFLVAQRPDLVAGCRHLILTPNGPEFYRLLTAVFPAERSLEACKGEENKRVEEAGRRDTPTSGLGAQQQRQQQNSALARAVAAAAARLPSLEPPLVAGGGGFAWASRADAAATAEVLALSSELGGVAVFRKGGTDIISDGDRAVLLGPNQEEGSPRRCGGVGDLLAGSTALLLNWALERQNFLNKSTGGHGHLEAGGATGGAAGDRCETEPPAASLSSASPLAALASPLMWAAWGAAVLMRRSNAAAFSIHRRSTTAPDVLECVGAVADAMLDDNTAATRE